MGEYADAILDGYMCEACGQFIDEDVDGHPRTCTDCRAEERTAKKHAVQRKSVQSASKRFHKQ